MTARRKQRYRFQAALGYGGMGEVYLAQDQELGQIRQLIDDNLSGYKDLIAELEEAARRGDNLYDHLAKHKLLVEKKEAGKKQVPPK